jgi:uncharacterized surface protein with fasciclin (FAS1) repeats
MRRSLVAALLAVATLAATPTVTRVSAQRGQRDIVDTLASMGFTSLVTALGAAGLVERLRGPGPFTVFAPIDEPPGTVSSLLRPEDRQMLTHILEFHVVPRRVMIHDLSARAQELQTLQGTPLQIRAFGGVVVHGASVVAADIEASNGVIHVVERVLVPD